ncbi:hypothetical protein [Ralstonia solanacearum]|uniref:hypothetical protein n=1 Tax=Ralstonia solanacearum TaxID=305 RepID=UPI0006DD2C62|nr:hypothetical protein [Ralstonia solanacearum]
MNISNAIGKKSTLFAVAAAFTLITNQAHAQMVMAVALNVQNATKGCVRVYVDGPQDIPAGQSKSFSVDDSRTFLASVFQGACGGKAAKTVRYSTNIPNSRQTWTIR